MVGQAGGSERVKCGDRMRYRDHFYVIGRWGLGVLFIYAGGRKLLDPEAFAVLIDAFGVVPENLLWPAARVLPALEITAGFGLLFDIRGSLAIIAGLLVFFIAILGVGLKMGLDVDCGCFGPQDIETRAFGGLDVALYRNLALLTVVMWLYGWRRRRDLRPTGLVPLVRGCFF